MTLLMCGLLGTGAQAAGGPPDVLQLGLEQLMSLEVVGASKYGQRQQDTPAAVSILTRQDIRAFGWRTLDDALASLPGVHQTWDRQYAYLGTRGFALPGDFNTRLLVTINGNRVNDPTFDAGPMGRQLPLDLEVVDRIEFIPGPGGAVYGQNAMFGVVNIITRDGGQIDGGELTLAYQQRQRTTESSLTLGRRFDGGLHLLVSGTVLRSRGQDLTMEYGDSGITGLARGMDGARDRDLFLRARHGDWSLDLVHGRSRKDDPTGAYISDPLTPGQYQGDSYHLASLRYEASPAGSPWTWTARAFAGYEHYSSRLIYGTPFLFPAQGKWRGLELQVVSRAFQGHTLMLGLEAQDNPTMLQEIRDTANPSADIRIADRGHRLGLFAQDEWKISDTLITTLGLRLDRRDGRTVSSPRLALIWHASPRSTFKALLGRAHREPNAYERLYDDGFAQLANPALAGERIDTLELVANHRVDRDFALRASAYAWSMKNLVTLGVEAGSGIAQYQSGPRVRARGLELSADRTWEGGLRLRTSLSAQHVVDPSGSPLPNAPKALVRMNLSGPLPWGGLRAGLEARHDSARLSLQGRRLGGFSVVNLNLVKDSAWPGGDLSLHVGNLLNRRYAHPGAESNWQDVLVQDGRHLRLGLNQRF